MMLSSSITIMFLGPFFNKWYADSFVLEMNELEKDTIHPLFLGIN